MKCTRTTADMIQRGEASWVGGLEGVEGVGGGQWGSHCTDLTWFNLKRLQSF